MLQRREFLRLGVSGLSLPSLFRLRNAVANEGSEPKERTALIVVFLHGGASHLETWDPKPFAPSEYRGPFQTIQTRTPGLDFCELLPRQAAISDKFTILRSMTHTGFCHGIGQQQMLTGHEVRQFTPRSQYPEILTITNHLRRDTKRELPNYVGVPPIPYLGAAYLGPSCEAFAVYGDPNSPTFKVPGITLADAAQGERMRGRIGLRQQFDRLQRNLDQTGNMQAMDEFEQSALTMLTSPHAKNAFDLSLEDPAIRDRYGRNVWGQQCLLARRLVESGVDLVTTTLAGPTCGRVLSWDDHAVNHHVFDAMKSRAPFFDQAVATLIEDLYERGLDRRVMVVVTGEFGRTPKISYAPDGATGVTQPGRDHWPAANSMMFAGGGIPVGQLIGATDPRGEQVIERRTSVHDLLATMYRHLGIQPRGISINDFSGRPIPLLNEGTPVPELISG